MNPVFCRGKHRKEGRSGSNGRFPVRDQGGHRLKSFRYVFVIGLLVWLLGMPLSLNAQQRKGLGTWIWSGSSFSTSDTREQLIRFCRKNGIFHLDVHIRMSRAGQKPILRDAAAFKDLIVLAGQYNITTAALRGSPKMFFAENQKKTLQELQAITAFSKTLPPGALFKGIKYDVEPYCTKEWKAGGTPFALMHDYLAFLRRAKSVLEQEAPQLWLAVDTPFWWDKDKFALEFEGKRKPLIEHVQDLTDFISVMSYRRSSQKVLACVENERRYAQKIKKVIFPSIETVELKKDSDISFWGLSNRELLKVVPELLASAKRDPVIGGVMVHCYRSLANKLGSDPSCRTLQ